jgi:hypothetical protein
MDGWIYLSDFIEPPPAPKGFKTEVKRDTFLGVVIAYKFVKEK